MRTGPEEVRECCGEVRRLVCMALRSQEVRAWWGRGWEQTVEVSEHYPKGFGLRFSARGSCLINVF